MKQPSWMKTSQGFSGFSLGATGGLIGFPDQPLSKELFSHLWGGFSYHGTSTEVIETFKILGHERAREIVPEIVKGHTYQLLLRESCGHKGESTPPCDEVSDILTHFLLCFDQFRNSNTSLDVVELFEWFMCHLLPADDEFFREICLPCEGCSLQRLNEHKIFSRNDSAYYMAGGCLPLALIT